MRAVKIPRAPGRRGFPSASQNPQPHTSNFPMTSLDPRCRNVQGNEGWFRSSKPTWTVRFHSSSSSSLISIAPSSSSSSSAPFASASSSLSSLRLFTPCGLAASCAAGAAAGTVSPGGGGSPLACWAVAVGPGFTVVPGGGGKAAPGPCCCGGCFSCCCSVVGGSKVPVSFASVLDRLREYWIRCMNHVSTSSFQSTTKDISSYAHPPVLHRYQRKEQRTISLPPTSKP